MKVCTVLVLVFSIYQICSAKEYKLVWSPEADKDGLKAFEHVEDERGHVHKVTHIKVEGNNYRFEMHTQDRDSIPDRQRQEVYGMAVNGKALKMVKGDTWKFTYSVFIPSTLKATTSFTHIQQIKSDLVSDTNPAYVMSLRRKGEVETIEAQVFTGEHILGSTNLKPLHDKWIDIELEYHVDETQGSATWTVSSDGNQVVHGTKSGVKTLYHEGVHPKWGIYRSLSDKKDEENTYMLLTKLKAYKME